MQKCHLILFRRYSPPADILLLGTFHFFESSIDFYSNKMQKELTLLAQKLLRFRPDAVAVEAAVHAQSAITSAYDKFRLSDLDDPDKMRNEVLGEISIFGQTCPITYNNEAIQLGYRLGKMLDLPDIHAVDDDLCFDMEVMKKKTRLRLSPHGKRSAPM